MEKIDLLFQGMKGVENVYTQHTSQLKDTLEEVLRGRPLDPQYPIMGSEFPNFRRPPQEIIVFLIGGCTYEEALAVHQMNAAGYRIILGGTTIHNSASFLENEVVASTTGIAFKHTKSLQAFHSSD
jgi:vacuolar protein sorting-associated protein 45